MSTLPDLSDRIALITGASRGLGAAFAKSIARAGAHVILIARTVGGLEEVDDAIQSEGGNATLMPLDLNKTSDLKAIGPTIAERFGKLDFFVGNAAILGALSPVAQSDPKQWGDVMRLNYEVNYRLILSLDPLLRASDAGRALFVTSSVGHQVRAYWSAYSVSKAALEMMVKIYAQETENTNLRVNLVNPGAVRTSMRALAYPGEDPKTLKTPDDLGDKILPYLADGFDQTGQCFDLQ